MKKKKQTLLWAIQRNDESPTSYVLGTMHARCEEAFRQIVRFCELINTCDHFVAELNLDDRGEGDWLQQAMLPQHKTISELLPPKKYEKLRRMIRKSSGRDISHFDRLLPVMLVNLVLEDLLPADQPYNLDQYLWDYALRQGKTLHGLESNLEQANVLRKIDLEDQLRDLVYLGKNLPKQRRELYKMINLYSSGDYQALFKTAKKQVGSARKTLLYKRNTVMTQRLAPIVDQGPTFCAIGAAHLGGQKGVLSLLKEAGFKMRPLEWKNSEEKALE
jgi:uncharacterized protein